MICFYLICFFIDELRLSCCPTDRLSAERRDPTRSCKLEVTVVPMKTAIAMCEAGRP